jgi:DnaJ-class molecular chaperone
MSAPICGACDGGGVLVECHTYELHGPIAREYRCPDCAGTGELDVLPESTRTTS